MLGSGALYGQQPAFQANAKSDSINNKLFTPFFLSSYTASSYINGSKFSASGLFARFSIGTAAATPVIARLQQDLYIRGFGFFCRKEMEIEKTVKLPLRFRLGSLEQCNILEQKY